MLQRQQAQAVVDAREQIVDGAVSMVQTALDQLLPVALERGVGIVAAAIYNSGLLSFARPASDARYDYEQAPAALLARKNCGSQRKSLYSICGVTKLRAAVRGLQGITGLQRPGGR